MPSRMLAKITHPHDGAQINSSGTGNANSQPAMRTGLCPYRSERVPAKKFVAAFTAPNATMKVSVAVNAVSPNSCLARSGRTVRSWPIIPPTSAFTPTSSENWAMLACSPRRNGVSVVDVLIGRSPTVGR